MRQHEGKHHEMHHHGKKHHGSAHRKGPHTLKKDTPLRMTLRRLAENKLALTGGIVFLLLCLMAIFAPLLAPYDYLAIDPPNQFLRPCAEHWLGTDQYGRDILSRLIWGARWSLSLGVASTLLSNILGIVVGSVAGYFGGKVDLVIMRITDIMQCIPGTLLTICLSVALGSGIVNTVIAMSIGGIWGTARMLRGQILTVRKSEYVEAAKATNNKSLRTIVKYVLPNSIQQTIISACMGIGGSISAISGLSFLGLGVQPPLPEWGAMLSDGRNYMRYYPNMLIAPCVMIALTILAISLFGDGLRDALDPRMKDYTTKFEDIEKKQTVQPVEAPTEGEPVAVEAAPAQSAAMDPDVLLRVNDLWVEYASNKRIVNAVNGISFDIKRGQSLGVVGESGCGKSTIAKAVLRVLPDNGARIAGGQVLYDGKNLADIPEEEMEKVRGAQIAMIFQDPMTALNPVQRILSQVSSVIRRHNPGMSKKQAEAQAIEMLKTVGISEDRVRDYPHQFSGGMQQRVGVAIGLSCHPELLLADEPTTALDVTIQAQVLDLIRDLMEKRGTTLLLITHNLGIVADMCDNVAVVYGGEIVEYGSKREIFKDPTHPYTIALFGALPSMQAGGARLKPIEGVMPDPSELPDGCKFHTRCPYATEECMHGSIPVADLGGTHQCRCCRIDAVKAVLAKEAMV